MDELFGQRVADPYRWLEDSTSARTIAWCAAQDALTARVLGGMSGGPHWRRALRRLVGAPAQWPPTWRGGRAFLLRQARDAAHPALWCRDADGEERVLVDPGVLDPSGATTLDGWSPSLEGTRLAYRLSSGGDEESRLYILAVDTGGLVEGPIPRCRNGPLAWLAGGDAYVYVRRLPDTAVPAGESHYHRRVWRHVVGTDPGEDTELLGAGLDPTSWYDVTVSADGRWLVVSRTLGAAPATDLWIADLTGTVTDGQLRPIRVDGDSRVRAWVTGGRLFLLTSWGAPRGRLCVTDPESPDQAQWREIIPEDPGATLTAAAVLDDGLIVTTHLRHAKSLLRVYHPHSAGDAGDALPAELPLPGMGTVTGLTTQPDGGCEVWIGYTDFVTQPRVLLWRRGETFHFETAAEPSAVDVVTDELWYPSKDGTPIHIFLLSPRHPPAGPRPTVLTGYGGFGVPVTPAYAPEMVAWVQSGGRYAVANVRGGGEYGEDWHRAGMREQKQNTIDDFAAVADGLVRDGWCTSASLGAIGSSNGGLLVAASITQGPTRFGAAVCGAPLCDMVRYERFGLGRLWSFEYGDAQNPPQLGWLLAYSPYHQVRHGTAYPPTLLTSFESDIRVDPVHARKMCAALQHASSAAGLVLLRREVATGHATRSTQRAAALLGDELTFLAHHLLLPTPDGTHNRKEVPVSEHDVRHALVEALREIADVDPAEVTDERSFVDDLDVDSLTMVEVLVVLEEKLGIKVPEEDIQEFATVGSAVAYLEAAASTHTGSHER